MSRFPGEITKKLFNLFLSYCSLQFLVIALCNFGQKICNKDISKTVIASSPQNWSADRGWCVDCLVKRMVVTEIILIEKLIVLKIRSVIQALYLYK